MSKTPQPSRPKDKRPPKDRPPFPKKPKDDARSELTAADLENAKRAAAGLVLTDSAKDTLVALYGHRARAAA